MSYGVAHLHDGEKCRWSPDCDCLGSLSRWCNTRAEAEALMAALLATHDLALEPSELMVVEDDVTRRRAEAARAIQSIRAAHLHDERESIAAVRQALDEGFDGLDLIVAGGIEQGVNRAGLWQCGHCGKIVVDVAAYMVDGAGQAIPCEEHPGISADCWICEDCAHACGPEGCSDDSHDDGSGPEYCPKRCE